MYIEIRKFVGFVNSKIIGVLEKVSWKAGGIER